MKNPEITIASQFANSPILLALIYNMNEYFSQYTNFENFYNQIWNIETAQGYGLDVWGRIVGVQRVLTVSLASNFGFSGADGASGDSFGVAPFYNMGPLTGNYALTDDAFRTLIYAKALANITDGSIPSINQLLMNLFSSESDASLFGAAIQTIGGQNIVTIGGEIIGTVDQGIGTTGQCWCTDNGNMTMTYTFDFTLSPVEYSIVYTSGVLPRPPGVSATIVQI